MNDRALNFPYEGKKYIDKRDSLTHKIYIPRINDIGDTVFVADQIAVKNYFETKYLPGMQNQPEVIILDFNNLPPIGEGGGQWTIFIRYGGNAQVIVFDYQNDGIIDEAIVRIPKIGGQFFWEDLAEEAFSGEAGPNNLNDLRLRNWTVLEGGSQSDTLYVFDTKLRKTGENYPPREGIERILGNVQMIDP